MALEPLELFDGVERGFIALDELSGADELEVVRCERREHAHADVGGRGPVRDEGIGRVLAVVRRQAMIVGADERVEVAPRLARDQAEEVRVRR